MRVQNGNSKNILLVVYYHSMCSIVFITTFQSKDNSNSAEDTYEGPRGNKYFEKNKSRTRTGKVQKNTIIIGVVFAVLSVVTGIVFAL